jgi:hypothetical protein
MNAHPADGIGRAMARHCERPGDAIEAFRSAGAEHASMRHCVAEPAGQGPRHAPTKRMAGLAEALTNSTATVPCAG